MGGNKKSKKLLLVREKILRWYRTNKRDLPWRKTDNPYYILISEVMLQQTQVLRVLPKYAEFIEAYPSIDALAHASLGDVLKIWSGLGYNRRAKYLKEMAEMVKNGYNGQIPNTYEALIKLPGIGDYTANAVLCFAFKKKRPAIDTNVRNVIEREFQKKEQTVTPGSEACNEIKEFVLQLMPDEHPDEFLHALMDYSSLTLARPKRNKSLSKPFKLSRRYLRGKLIAKLIHRSYREFDLVKIMRGETGRDTIDITSALKDLQKEGLVMKHGELLRLP